MRLIDDLPAGLVGLCTGVSAISIYVIYTLLSEANATQQSSPDMYVIPANAVRRFEVNPGTDFHKAVLERAALTQISFAGTDKKKTNPLPDVLENIVNVVSFNTTQFRTPWLFSGNPKGYFYSKVHAQGIMLTPEGHMLTAAHVVMDSDDKFRDWNKYHIITKDKHVWEVEETLAISTVYDLALTKTNLRVKNRTPPTFVTSETLKEGTDYKIIGRLLEGNPRYTVKDDEVFLTNKDDISLTDYYSQGQYAYTHNRWNIYDDGTLRYGQLVFDMHAQPGFSGGVVADVKGNIAGIVSGTSWDGRHGRAMVGGSTQAKELVDSYLTTIERWDKECTAEHAKQ